MSDGEEEMPSEDDEIEAEDVEDERGDGIEAGVDEKGRKKGKQTKREAREALQAKQRDAVGNRVSINGRVLKENEAANMSSKLAHHRKTVGSTTPTLIQNFVAEEDAMGYDEKYEESVDFDLEAALEGDSIMFVQKMTFESLPLVPLENYMDLPEDHEGAKILCPEPRTLKAHPDLLYKPGYKNWGDGKRSFVIVIGLILFGIFLWQLTEIDFEDPANLWKILVMLIFNMLVPMALFIRAFKPNEYYRITSKNVYAVKKYAFNCHGRKMTMFSINDVLAVEVKSKFHFPCAKTPNAGTMTLYTLHANHPTMALPLIGAFDIYLLVREYMEAGPKSKQNKDKARQNQIIFPVEGETDAGLADGICEAICCCAMNRYNVTRSHATKMKKKCCWVQTSNVFMSRVFDVSMSQNTLQASEKWNWCCQCCCCCKYFCCCCKWCCGAKHMPDNLAIAFPRFSGTVVLHHLRQDASDAEEYRKFLLNVPNCKDVILRFGSEVDYQKAMANALKVSNMGKTAEHYHIGPQKIVV